ncbi:MAG: phosphatidate cytidylyltransferase [Oscillospiraceae bacterium]|nr:phosphatidate cytidylyltransferase [Oscillospiraceae bacterium]
MKKRVISAVILIAIVLICVFASYVTRVLFFAVAGILCAYEFSRNVEKLNVYCCAWVMYVYIAIQAVLTLFHAGVIAYISCMAGGIYLALFSGILHKKVSGSGALYTLAGLSYPCFLFGLLMAISVSSIWLPSLVIAAIATWSCDSFALFGGMRFGKHKLAPLVSPNKTIEGCLCGALASVVAGVILYLLPIFPEYSLPVFVITALLASTLGQIGDLAESLIKRMIGVKDFSNLIPGHGGMFDRADSLLFSIPTAYLCLYIAGLM